jgi:hypothetical protein
MGRKKAQAKQDLHLAVTTKANGKTTRSTVLVLKDSHREAREQYSTAMVNC